MTLSSRMQVHLRPKTSFLESAAKSLKYGDYKATFRKMQNSSAFLKHAVDSVGKDIQRELRSYKSAFVVGKGSRMASYEYFSWKDAYTVYQLKKGLPHLN